MVRTTAAGEPAFRHYASVNDAVRRSRRRARTAWLICAGLAVAGSAVAGKVLVQSPAPAPRHVAAAPSAATAAPATAAPAHATPDARRPGFQVAGVHVVARRVSGQPGVDRISVSPGVAPAGSADVRRSVLAAQVTGARGRLGVRAVTFRDHPATRERYVATTGVAMTALYVQWTARTGYLLRAPSGAAFTRLTEVFRAG